MVTILPFLFLFPTSFIYLHSLIPNPLSSYFISSCLFHLPILPSSFFFLSTFIHYHSSILIPHIRSQIVILIPISYPHAYSIFPFFHPYSSHQITDKHPTRIKNIGIWLRYDSRSGTHNMYREYRDITVAGAVTQCCE